MKIFFALSFIIISSVLFAQQNGLLKGKITDAFGKPVDLANISIPEMHTGTTSDSKGNFEITLPAGSDIKVQITCIGYKPIMTIVNIKSGETTNLNTSLESQDYITGEVNIEARKERFSNLNRIDPKVANLIPGAMSGVEAILKTFPGVSSNNELSSQYSVRGGNFDENLVYVNDIEIYRPFLVRSGQQEGLSFINPDMVSSILFSAGGFDAKYGDKMSSVLDIKYKKPTEFAASGSLSLLGGSAHIEGNSDNHRFTHITGFRYKTTQYVLNSLETKGDYKPSFIDLQTFLTYDITEKFEINFLGNFARNNYLFVPESRKTAFGNVNVPLGLTVYFEGKELDKYTTATGAFSGNYKVNQNTILKFIASAYKTSEEETYDIMGQYFLNELDKEIGSDNIGDSLMNIGVGTYLEHARNYLDASVYTFSHKGTFSKNEHVLNWGIQYQYEFFSDQIKEWKMLDSAGYSIPYSDSVVSVNYYLKTNISNQTHRLSSYIQENYSLELDSAYLNFTAGLRSNYWDYTNELLISPRASISFDPNWKRETIFRFSSGFYYQPPFYKELRDINGIINPNIRSQKSIHFVLGGDYSFNAWNRPFKLISEIYYKLLYNLIPYDVDNVRIKYYGKNNAKGYAKGIDFKINGEFVKGVDSWASLSIMETREDIENDTYYIGPDSAKTLYENGYLPRPTDQRVNFGLFFQDYLPGNPSYKMQLSLLFGSRLPFGPPGSVQYRNAFRIPPYRRVDIGFAKVIISENPDENKTKVKWIKSLWLTAEVFNLLGTNNTISYMWISDIYNRQYAIPNYLTARRLNIKLTAKF